MPANPESPRGRFVEAMQAIEAHLDPKYHEHTPLYLKAACEAFVDASCKERRCSDQDHWGAAGVCKNDDIHSEEQHATCRRDLLREVGLGEDGQC